MSDNETEIIAHIRKAMQDVKDHEHTREDYFCINLYGWLGERAGWLLARIAERDAEIARLIAIRERLLWMTDLPMGSKPSVDLIDFADAIRQTINSPGCQYCPPTPGCTSCSLDGDCECYEHQHLSEPTPTAVTR